MPRRGVRTSKWLQLDGPLFEEDVDGRLIDAINEGVEETGREAAGILAGFIATSGFVKTGGFLRGVDSEMRKREGEPGYAKVGVFSGAWPEDDRPTRTWFERGTRGGQKFRKGMGGFSKTATRVKDFSYENIEAAIERALN